MELKDRLEYIRRCIKHLDYLREEYGPEKTVKTFLTLTSLLYSLQTAIQALIDIGLRFLAERGAKPPQQYAEIGYKLQEEGVFNQDDATLFKKIVGFRNIVVHRYIGVDIDLLKRILRDRLYIDIMELAHKIVKKAEEMGIDP